MQSLLKTSIRVGLVTVALCGLTLALLASARSVSERLRVPFRVTVLQPDPESAHPLLSVSCCDQIEEIVFLRLNGFVTNVGSRSLKNVVIRAAFLDEKGRTVAVAKNVLDPPMLRPSATAAFEITTPVDLAISKVSVDFSLASKRQLSAKYEPRNGMATAAR